MNPSSRSSLRCFAELSLLSSSLLGFSLLLVGCDGKQQTTPVAKPQPPKEPPLVHVEGLPELDDYYGPRLDENRIQVPLPVGWYVRPRSSKYLIRIQPSASLSYPSIIVTATDYVEVFNLSPQNVNEFSRQITDSMEAHGTAARLIVAVAPIKVGPVSGISYRRRGRLGTKIMERLFIETVAEGRKYTFELRAHTGTLSESRPYLLAVVAGVRFLDIQAVDRPPEEPSSDPAAIFQ